MSRWGLSNTGYTQSNRNWTRLTEGVKYTERKGVKLS